MTPEEVYKKIVALIAASSQAYGRVDSIRVDSLALSLNMTVGNLMIYLSILEVEGSIILTPPMPHPTRGVDTGKIIISLPAK